MRHVAFILFASLLHADARACPPPQPLEPTEEELTRDAPSRGPATAPVTIVAYIDYQCPFSARVWETLKGLRSEYGDKVRLVVHQHPLGTHPHAAEAARAALAAGAQGRFWEMHEALFERPAHLTHEDLLQTATRLGLSMPAFEAALVDPALAARLQANLASDETFDIYATPTLFINHYRALGVLPVASLRSIIDRQLGVEQSAPPPESFWDRLVTAPKRLSIAVQAGYTSFVARLRAPATP